MLSKLTSLTTLVKLPFIGGKLVRPLSTDLSPAQFMQIGIACSGISGRWKTRPSQLRQVSSTSRARIRSGVPTR